LAATVRAVRAIRAIAVFTCIIVTTNEKYHILICEVNIEKLLASYDVVK